MRNHGGPGKLAELFLQHCLALQWDFFWLHNSKHSPASYPTPYDISEEECLKLDFDLILYNQWRVLSVFEKFQGRVPQILLCMYEEIPVYWQDFRHGLNNILAPCAAVGKVLGLDLNVLKFAVPPMRHLKGRPAREIPTFFFPARDGGENDRKGVTIFAKALQLTDRKFAVKIALTKQAQAHYQETCPSLFEDTRIELQSELSKNDYWREMGTADALLCPSRTSGIELATLDAVATGTDVVVTDTPPMNEYFSSMEAWMVAPRPASDQLKKPGIVPIDQYEASHDSLAAVMDDYQRNSRASRGGRTAEQRWCQFKADLMQFMLQTVARKDVGIIL